MDLKKIFKRIHPDLFHDNELQRATNEKSFQYLSQFLDCTQTEDYDLHFYFYDDNQILKEAKVKFNAPPLHATPSIIKSHVIRHIKILTLAIELDLEEVFGRDHEKNNAASQSKSEIINFLKDNLAEARRKSEDYNRENKLIENLKNKVEYATNCKVMVSGSLSYAKCKGVLESLYKHAAEIEKFKLKNQYLYVIAEGFYYKPEISINDNMIRIPSRFRAEKVLEFLAQNHKKAREQAELHKQRKELLENTKKILCLQLRLNYLGQSVFCTDEDCLATLETIQAVVLELKALKVRGLSFIIGDRNSLEKNGTLYIAANLKAADLVTFIETNIAQARALRNQEVIYDLEIGELEDTIKAELPLYFYASFDVTKPNYISALQNIIKAIPLLKGLDFGGDGICISTEFKVTDFGTIHIPYNFTIEDLKDFLPHSAKLKRLK